MLVRLHVALYNLLRACEVSVGVLFSNRLNPPVINQRAVERRFARPFMTLISPHFGDSDWTWGR